MITRDRMMARAGISRRRALAAALSAAAAGIGTAAAEAPSNVPRIGFLRHVPAELDSFQKEAFRAGLRDFGYIEGKTITVLDRYTSGREDLLTRYVNEIVALPVDVIVTAGTPAVGAAARATRTIPIVMAAIGDPVKSGFVASIARPGGNVTGIAIMSSDLVLKRLELLREAVPKLATVGIVYRPANALHGSMLVESLVAAKSLGIAVKPILATLDGGFDKGFAAMANEQVDAILILDDGLYRAHSRDIIALAMKRKLPTVAGLTGFERAGALITYTTDDKANFRRAAYFVDKILRGAKPADLPVEQSTRIALAINLRTARALGLELPPAILLRADEVIE